MGVPKRRQSHARKNKRRSEWKKIESPGLIACPQCRELMLPHRACLSCGFYKGKHVM